MQEFDIAELQNYDGNDGRPVYVAYKGKVYDISDSKLWRNGLHMKRHHAGQDMTTDILGAPREPDVLERYPQVGTLKKESAEVAELEDSPATDLVVGKSSDAQASSPSDDRALSHCVFVFHNDFQYSVPDYRY